MCPSGASVKMFTARGSFMDKFLMPVHNSAKTDGLSFHEFRNVVYGFRKISRLVSRLFPRYRAVFAVYHDFLAHIWLVPAVRGMIKNRVCKFVKGPPNNDGRCDFCAVFFE